MCIRDRPHITVKYIDVFQKYTKAKVIYYGHDLHFLREMREYELTHDEELHRSALKWKGLELELMRKADVVLTPSSDEKRMIDQELGKEKAGVSPIFYFDKPDIGLLPIEQRQGILFVGGFRHHPNEDGVLWFMKEVWPLIHLSLIHI